VNLFVVFQSSKHLDNLSGNHMDFGQTGMLRVSVPVYQSVCACMCVCAILVHTRAKSESNCKQVKSLSLVPVCPPSPHLSVLTSFAKIKCKVTIILMGSHGIELWSKSIDFDTRVHQHIDVTFLYKLIFIFYVCITDERAAAAAAGPSYYG
jgi:hypothetical protein